MAFDVGAQGPDYAYNAPWVGPDLAVWATPEAVGGHRPPLGLSSQGNSQGPVRRGLSGMPASARKAVRQTLALMEEIRSRLGMWTVTLPDEDYRDLRELGTWPVFQRRLVDRLVQYLKAHGDPALVLAVVEVGGRRTARTGRPMPHVHIVTTGWASRLGNGTWLLCPGAMDQLVASACADAGLPSRARPAASQVAKIRSSVRSYLSKYMTKGAQEPGSLADGWDALIPRQWWNRSEAAKDLVDDHLFRLPPSFAAFVCQQRARLEGMRLGFARVVQVGTRQTLTGERAIEAFCFRFRDPEALLQAIECWGAWVISPAAFEAGAG